DGIRDATVTGVQTCALPILQLVSIDAQLAQELTYAERVVWKRRGYELGIPMLFDHEIHRVERRGNRIAASFRNLITGEIVERTEIGRASCRERGEVGEDVGG